MATTKTEPVIRALDLGWGYTKYTVKNRSTGALETASFPSLAPRHAGMDLSLSIIGRRDTTIVSVEGTEYEVGPDSGDLESTDATRNLNDQYIHTDQYRALAYGAMHYMLEPVIDLLVVGLPLSGMANAEKLRAMLEGAHQLNKHESVTVKEVLVLPQPLGGLYYCLSKGGSQPEFEFLKEEVNLVIDPGFLTFDFLLANGDRIVESRSSAHIGGVSKVLRAIADSISKKTGTVYDNLSALDKGLRRRKVKINGVVEDLAEHIGNTRSILEGSVNYMKNIVGAGADVDNIILLGGGATVYQKTIQAYYPKHAVITIDDGQMANVKGFQLAGEAHTAGKR